MMGEEKQECGHCRMSGLSAGLLALQGRKGSPWAEGRHRREEREEREETTLSLSLCFTGEETWAHESCV
jgi:hypothetical protein